MARAVIIGGGFFGVVIASHLAQRFPGERIVLLERERRLMQRASYSNQARIHNGYHYPRSFTTAHRSRVNLPRFVERWPQSAERSFTKVYGIARRNSKVTAGQFVQFCRSIGARLEPAPESVTKLFSPQLIERLFLVEEFAFDSSVLERWALQELQDRGVEVHLGAQVESVHRTGGDGLRVVWREEGRPCESTADRVFNCTYAALNQLGGDFPGTTAKLKHEIAELALVQMPPELVGMGFTLMDGPFFSCMPFPSRPGLHTLTHVRYTPHMSLADAPDADPLGVLARYEKQSRVDRMVRDASRYLPALARCRHADSLFEVKTVLVKNEVDDGRPILFERHAALPRCYSVLGGKLDNVFDIIERLDLELDSDSRAHTGASA